MTLQRIHGDFEGSVENMKSASFALLVVMGMFAAACQGAPPELGDGEGAPVHQSIVAGVGVPEFRYATTTSAFRLGTVVSVAREDGFDKTIGSDGVLAVDVVNGMLMGVLNAKTSYPKFQGSKEEHEAGAKQYFLSRGLPSDQLGRVSSTVSMSGGGSVREPMNAQPDTVEYTSIASRVVVGVPVVESQAVVRFEQNGKTTLEMVYWPALPPQAVSDAQTLKAVLSSPALAASYVGRTPSGGETRG